MTVAVCFKCGSMKHGAFKLCPECNRRPESEDDMAASLAFTDHYYTPEDLKRIGSDIAKGEFPKFDPATWEELLGGVRNIRGMLNTQGSLAPSKKPEYTKKGTRARISNEELNRQIDMLKAMDADLLAAKKTARAEALNPEMNDAVTETGKLKTTGRLRKKITWQKGLFRIYLISDVAICLVAVLLLIDGTWELRLFFWFVGCILPWIIHYFIKWILLPFCRWVRAGFWTK